MTASIFALFLRAKRRMCSLQVKARPGGSPASLPLQVLRLRFEPGAARLASLPTCSLPTQTHLHARLRDPLKLQKGFQPSMRVKRIPPQRC